MPKLNQKNIKNKIKNTQKYLPNPPKMGPKSLPGTLLGALLPKVLLFHQISIPMEVQWEPRGSSKITKTRKKRVLKKHLKSVPQKTSKISDLGGAGPAGSC